MHKSVGESITYQRITTKNCAQYQRTFFPTCTVRFIRVNEIDIYNPNVTLATHYKYTGDWE